MSSQSISRVLPDPFTTKPDHEIIPLTNVMHMSSAAILSVIPLPTQQQPAIRIDLPAGLFSAPIIIPENFANVSNIYNIFLPHHPKQPVRLTNNYFQLPTLRDLMSIWGGTYANDAVVISGKSFVPLRQNCSRNQVQVGDVFSVPVFNFSQDYLAIVPGQGSSMLENNHISFEIFDLSYNAIFPRPSVAGSNDSLVQGRLILKPTVLPSNKYQQLIFIINELPSPSNLTGSYQLVWSI